MLFKRETEGVCIKDGSKVKLTGVYQSDELLSGCSAGQLAAMYCPNCKDARRCQFYRKCCENLSFIE